MGSSSAASAARGATPAATPRTARSWTKCLRFIGLPSTPRRQRARQGSRLRRGARGEQPRVDPSPDCARRYTPGASLGRRRPMPRSPPVPHPRGRGRSPPPPSPAPQAASPPPTAEARAEARGRARRLPLEARPEAPLPRVRRQGARRLPRQLRAGLVAARGPLAVHRLRGPGHVDGGDRRPPAPDARAEYLPYVRHGVRYLADVMWDREHGGFHTLVDLSGRGAHGRVRRPAGVRPGLRDLRPGRRPRRDAATPSPSSSRSAPGAGSRTTTGTTSGPGTAAR